MLGVKEKRASYLLMISCCIIFLVNVGLKSVYSSALVSIQSEFSATKTQTRIGSLVYYLAYGITQILMVIFIKKLNIGKIFAVASISTAICYTIMLFTNEMWQFWVVLGLCGVLDAPLWSGCIYFVGKYLKNEYLTKANSFLSVSTPLGFALSFGVVSLFIALDAWRFAYLFLSIIMLCACGLFLYSEKYSEKHLNPIEKAEVENSSADGLSRNTKRFYFLVVLYVAVCVAILGGATYSMNQIMPEMMFSIYNFPKATSTLVTTLLPVINAIVNILLFKLVDKGVYYLKISFVISILCFISAIALYFLFDMHWAVLLVLAIIFTCTLSASTQFFCGVFPLQIRSKYNSASSSALTNGLLATMAGVTPFLCAMLLDLGDGKAFGNVFLLIIGIAFITLVMVSVLYLTRKRNSLLND